MCSALPSPVLSRCVSHCWCPAPFPKRPASGFNQKSAQKPSSSRCKSTRVWMAGEGGAVVGRSAPRHAPPAPAAPPQQWDGWDGAHGGVPGVTPPCGSIPRSSLSAATAQARGSRMRNSSTRGGFGGGWRGNDAARELDLGTLLCTQHQAAGTAPKLAAWPGGKPTRRAGPSATVMGTATTNPFPRWARRSAPLRTPQKRDEGGGGWGHVRTPALPPHCSAPYLLPPHGSAGLAPAFGSSFPKYF